MQTSLFTTRLDSSVIGLIKEHSRQSDITQREFIEEAVRHFSIEKKREKIIQSFSHVGEDSDSEYFANNGFEDILSY